jgi:hypothetical protein
MILIGETNQCMCKPLMYSEGVMFSICLNTLLKVDWFENPASV